MNLDHEMESHRTSSHQQWQGWKYSDVDLCPRDGAATRARTVWTPELGRRVGMARGVLEMAATESRTSSTADLGQVVGKGPGFLETARPPGRGRRGHPGEGRFVAW